MTLSAAAWVFCGRSQLAKNLRDQITREDPEVAGSCPSPHMQAYSCDATIYGYKERRSRVSNHEAVL